MTYTIVLQELMCDICTVYDHYSGTQHTVAVQCVTMSGILVKGSLHFIAFGLYNIDILYSCRPFLNFFQQQQI